MTGPGSRVPASGYAPNSTSTTAKSSGSLEDPVLNEVPREVFIVPKFLKLIRFLPHQLVDGEVRCSSHEGGFLKRTGISGSFFSGSRFVDDLQERIEIGIGDFVADVSGLGKLLRPGFAAGR